MVDGTTTAGLFGSAQARLEDKIEDVKEQLDVEQISVDSATSSPEAAWLSFQTLRDGDRGEALLDSLRQFRWHLSLVEAAAASPLEDQAE